jgi:hypothetical protein
MRFSGREDRPNFVNGVGLNGFDLNPRRHCKSRYISRDMSATHCLAERSPDCAMYLMGSDRPCVGQDHLLIKAFKAFRQ